MDVRKRKVSVTLDADLLAELSTAGGTLSAQVNEAVRQEVHRRRQQAALRRYLDEVAAEEGPLDSPEDLAALADAEAAWRELDDRAVPGDGGSTGPARRAS